MEKTGRVKTDKEEEKKETKNVQMDCLRFVLCQLDAT